MELEVLKTPDIDQRIESDLTINADYNFVSVSNDEELAKAEEEIKQAKSDQKNLVNKIKPLKQAIDDFKAKFLSKEKIESAKVETFGKTQETEISKYKTAKLEEQRKAKAEAERKAKEEADRIRREEETRVEEERKRKQAELEALKTSEGTAEDKLEKAFALTDKIQSLENVVVPEVEIKPEKVVLKKDEVKTKKVFSIIDEPAFIEWALQNDRSVLQISISKSAFNEWVKQDKNQLNEYITFKEEVI